MDKKELRKANSDIFFEAERQGNNSFIHVNWIGIQSIEMIILGANQLLTMLREHRCSAILNSNQELIGPWHDGALFLASQWAPQAKKAGVLYFAHVLAPGTYGRSSFEKFYQLAQHHLQIESFNTDEEAAAWLLR